MPTVNVRPGSNLELQEIADVLGKSKKVIVVTGAGISTNCGIPDFRSENGLYSMIQAQYDAALANPPWESRDEYDIDDRPKKKRRRWYYEVVRQEDGEVVQVIDEEMDNLEDKEENNAEGKAEESPSEALIERPHTRRSSPISTSPQQLQQLSNTLCSSPLSSPPATPSETAELATQSTVASSVASTRSQSPIEIPQASQSSQASRTELPNLKGKDLFDSMVWKDPFTTSIFYMFITKFRQTIQQEVTTLSPTHQFIRTLRDAGRLVRNYTQNIDCLEERMDLCTDLERGPGNRARFSSKIQREHRPADIKRDSPHDGGVECVQLHGSLVALRCQVCGKGCSWDASREATTLSGHAPDCPSCQEYSIQRAGKGRRGIAIGRLRPDIVLYGEEHPSAGLVGPIITHDLGLNPDVLLILGTSLRVHGLKVMVREFAKAVHSRGGKVVFVNRTKPPESTWGDVIDYWVGWDCDEWVMDLKDRRGDIWLPQGTIHEENKLRRESAMEARAKKESTTDTKPDKRKGPRPQCIRDDKMNGVYVTFKILDILGMLTDSDGNTSNRATYWPNNARRLTETINQEPLADIATISAVTAPKLKKDPFRPVAPTSKKRKSLPVATTSTHLANTSQPRKPRKSCPPIQSNKKEDASYIAATWERIRKVAPSLSENPPASGRIALEELSANMSPLIKTYVNIYPFEYRKTYFGARVPLPNLITHPPCGLTIPMHTPKRDPPKHAYSTRAKLQSYDPEETIIVTSHPGPESSSPRSPGQIKDLGSISAILSSSPDCSQGSSNDVYFDAQETLVTP